MPSPVEELLAECESAIQSRNFEDAITGCRTVLTMAPDNLRAKELLEEAQSKLEAELFVRENMRKAQEAFQNRDYQKCINECQKIQLLDPDNPAVSELLSRAQEKLEAEPFIQNFITSGQSLFDSGLYGEAVAQWEKVRSIDPMFPGLDELIRSAKTRSGAPVDAAPAAIFQLDTASTGPELNLDSGLGFTPEEEASGGFGFDSDKERIQKLLREGDELAGSGDHQKAIEVWSEIFMLDVSNEDALQRIEASRNVLAALSPTMESEQGAEEEGAGSLESLMQKGTQAEAAGQYREAAQYLSQALAIDADNADLADRIKNLNLLAKKTEQGKAVLGNAKAFFAEGKVESARHALSKILEADPENEEALELMREIKSSGAAGAPEMRAPVASKAPPARSFPVIPAAVVVGVILVGGGLFAYFGMGKKDGGSQDQPAHVKVEPKTPGQEQKTPSNPGMPGTTTEKPVVTTKMREAADKLVAEANFYMQEKHFAEALQKADEALKLDPENRDANGIKVEATRRIREAQAAEKKLLTDANNYFEFSEFAGAVRLYEKYLEAHPEAVNEVQPQIIKCYYNLGVISIRQWKCDTSADYFRQVLFIDENDQLSKDGLALARKCQQVGTSDLEMRKQVTFLEMRK